MRYSQIISETDDPAQDPQESPENGLRYFWHGGRWEGPPEVQKPRKGRYEGGPGIYLTNKYATAAKYAKGGGTTMLVGVDRNLSFAENVMIPLEDGIEFVKRYLKRKAEIIADLKRNCARTDAAAFRAQVLINLTVNYEAGSGKAGLALAKFLASRGVDAEHWQKGDGEHWIVIINPEAIKSVKRVAAKDVSLEMRHLPGL